MSSRLFRIIGFLGLASVAAGITCSHNPNTTRQDSHDLKSLLGRYFSGLPDGCGAVTPSELAEQIRTIRPAIVELREAKEIAATGYIPGSIGIPVRTLMKNLNRLSSKDQPIVATCGSGHRSALAMAALQLLGYSNVKSLAGGFGAWKAAGLPVATGAPTDSGAGPSPDVDANLLASLDKYLSGLPDGWSTIAPQRLKPLMELSKPFQLDLRDTGAIAETGHIPGSVAVPIRILIENLDKLPPDKNALLVVESASGHEAAVAQLGLALLGYTNTRSLAGGIAGWTKAGLPLANAAPSGVLRD